MLFSPTMVIKNLIRNPVGVQLLPPSIRQQIFPTDSFPPPSERVIRISKEHLMRHDLAQGLSDPIDAPLIKLPPLQGKTIDQHFKNLGIDRAEPYLSLAKAFSLINLPPIPTNWSQLPGWTVYHPDGAFEAIDHPPENEEAFVMDVETFPAHTQCAVMATAVSGTCWYSWLSPWLVEQTDQPDHLIPMPSTSHRLIVGHHVGFDRARIKDEYSLRVTQTRFLDTMSLHIATFGLSNPQRPAYQNAKKKKLSFQTKNDDEHAENPVIQDPSTPNTDLQTHDNANQNSWTDVASMNSLEEVAKLHCGIQLDKTIRNAFLEWDKSQLMAHIPQLLEYCASDVTATYTVYQKLLPIFLEQCPHPVSFAGMLHMGNPFLPVNESWETFLNRSESTFLTKSTTVKTSLLRLAEATRKLMFVKDPKTGRPIYEDDHWLKQLDWTPKKARWTSLHTSQESSTCSSSVNSIKPEPSVQGSGKKIPAWLADLSVSKDGDTPVSLDSPLAALLFKVRFQGSPLLWSRKLGWMFGLVVDPGSKNSPVDAREVNQCDIPDHIQLFEHEHIFRVPNAVGSSEKRVWTVFSRQHIKLFEKSIFSSPYPEAFMACRISKTSNVTDDSYKMIQKRLSELIQEAKAIPHQDAMLDPWLRQLDWTPVPEEPHTTSNHVDPPHSDLKALNNPSPTQASVKTVKLPEEDKVWPHWYWLLARSGINNIGLTTKSQLTPLLLRLSFCGFPLYRSKQHGWVFRIPLRELTEPYSLRTPLVFNIERDPMFFNDQETAVYFKLPHPDGDSQNVGSPLSKSFDKAFEDEILSANPLQIDHSSLNDSSESTNSIFQEADSHALADNARQALSMNTQCSYWLNASQRIKDQMVIWNTDQSDEKNDKLVPPPSKQGMILPQVTVMGTITRRATEKTWLAAANAKKNKIGTELKSMVQAPPGYAIVGADVDSEELWISSVMGDAQFGMHGATAIGWMTLEGTKAAGTDLHSKTASILGISRNDAKVFNYSRIYGAGIAHAVQLLMKANPTASKEDATKLAKQLYASTKGIKNYRGDMFGSKFWYGGTESYLFNKLEQIALADHPQTPALDCGITRALRKCHLPNAGEGPDFMTSRVNWVVQSSGVDYLHMLIVAMDYLIDRYGIDARYMISVHDEIRYLSGWEDRYRCALALQIANLWTRCQFAFKLEMDDLPQSCAWFSAVDVDHVLRKEVDLPCVTPSNPDPIPPGESLDIMKLINVTPMGLGKVVKPLEITHSSTSVSPYLTKSDTQVLKHRSTDLEWLAAQSCQDRDQVRQHWNRARQQQRKASMTQRKFPRHMTMGESCWIQTTKLDEEKPQEQLQIQPIETSAKPQSSSSTLKQSYSKPASETSNIPHSSKLIKKVVFSNRDDDPDLLAWKVFDTTQSLHHDFFDRL